MTAIKELGHHTSPAGRPQPIAFHDGTLWVGCWDTSHLYAVDPKTWAVLESVSLPGKPYGIASFGGALRVVVSVGEDDDRYIYRFVPGQGLTEDGRVACPDLSGSHLTTDGKALYLVQQGNRRILELGADGSVTKTIDLPTRCAGLGFDAHGWFMISADDEFDVLQLGPVDLAAETAELGALVPMDVDARGLAFGDGAWWTSRREHNDIVSFSLS